MPSHHVVTLSVGDALTSGYERMFVPGFRYCYLSLLSDLHDYANSKLAQSVANL